MNIDQEKMIVEALPSLYPLQEFEEKAIDTVLNAIPHWIPVTERLPEEETDVLVTVHFLGLKRTLRNGWNAHIKESFYVEVASHINGEWSSASDEYKIARDRHKVVAWMPLPEPMSEQYKNKQSNCNKMPLPEPYKGVTE